MKFYLFQKSSSIIITSNDSFQLKQIEVIHPKPLHNRIMYSYSTQDLVVKCQNVIMHITKLPGSVFQSFHTHSAYKDLVVGRRHSFKVNSCVSPNAILQRPNIQKILPWLFVEFLNFFCILTIQKWPCTSSLPTNGNCMQYYKTDISDTGSTLALHV